MKKCTLFQFVVSTQSAKENQQLSHLQMVIPNEKALLCHNHNIIIDIDPAHTTTVYVISKTAFEATLSASEPKNLGMWLTCRLCVVLVCHRYDTIHQLHIRTVLY